jgi:predicted nucleic acid-binding Zn ribbon protein
MIKLTECLWCGDSFESNETYFNINGFCSEECYFTYKETVPIIKSNTSKICVICGSLFEGNEEFCSASCSIKYCEERGIWYQRVKLKMPNPYCKKFNLDLKTRVREFFNDKCVICGKTKNENRRNLSVHHVNYDKKAGCNGNEILLAPLCDTCHHTVHKDKEYWGNVLESIISEQYNNKCYYTKEQYELMKNIKNGMPTPVIINYPLTYIKV